MNPDDTAARWVTVTSMAQARRLIREFRYHEVSVSPEWSDDAGLLTVRVQKQDLDFLCSRFFCSRQGEDELRALKNRTLSRVVWTPMRTQP